MSLIIAMQRNRAIPLAWQCCSTPLFIESTMMNAVRLHCYQGSRPLTRFQVFSGSGPSARLLFPHPTLFRRNQKCGPLELIVDNLSSFASQPSTKVLSTVTRPAHGRRIRLRLRSPYDGDGDPRTLPLLQGRTRQAVQERERTQIVRISPSAIFPKGTVEDGHDH